MKILHFYPKSDQMIAQYVGILADGMRNSAEVERANAISQYKQRLRETPPDIVHIHGCWQFAMNQAAAMARKAGVRVVLSPHGQLAPWIVKEKSAIAKDTKSPTAIAGRSEYLQRRTVERAYAIIVFGKMEKQSFENLGWNPRVEVISNTIITNSISPQEMCSQVFRIYQKVIDSNVLEQMSEKDEEVLAAIIKAGITGDRRWVGNIPYPAEDIDWRRILIYAEHQNIRNYVDYGISILGLQADNIDTSKIIAYFPEKYQRPRPLKELTGDYKGDEADYLLRMIRQIQTAPCLLHLIELSRELRRDNVDDDQLAELLEDKHLTTYASRLMQILAEQTLLEEGYMPIPPTDDRGTRQIRNLIANHLKI